MISDTNSNGVLSREEKEELVLDLYFNNKTYHEIAKTARISPRDIKPIIDKHIRKAVQAYELFYKGKTPLEVAIILNIGQAQATAYYGEYLRLVQLDDITKIYQELQGGVWYFVKLCKAAKAAKMGVSQLVNLLRIANNYLPLAENRYEELQKQNSILDSNLHTAAKEFQFLTNQISFMGKRVDGLKSECENEIARVQDLRYQAANLQTVVNEFKSDDSGDYIKVIKAVNEEVHKNISNIKPLIDLALFSIIQSMRDNPDKYSCLVCSDNPRSITNNSNGHNMNSVRQQQSQYGYYSIEDCKIELLEQAKEFYIFLVDRFVCEILNGSVTNSSSKAALPSVLQLEEADDSKQEYTQQNDVLIKDEQWILTVTRELENIKRKIVCEPFTLLTVLVLNNDTKPQTVLNGKGLDDPLSGKLFSVGAIKPKEFLECGASNLQDGKYPFYLQSEPNVKGELVVVSSANK